MNTAKQVAILISAKSVLHSIAMARVHSSNVNQFNGGGESPLIHLIKQEGKEYFPYKRNQINMLTGINKIQFERALPFAMDNWDIVAFETPAHMSVLFIRILDRVPNDRGKIQTQIIIIPFH